jgi:hypothetical protein
MPREHLSDTDNETVCMAIDRHILHLEGGTGPRTRCDIEQRRELIVCMQSGLSPLELLRLVTGRRELPPAHVGFAASQTVGSEGETTTGKRGTSAGTVVNVQPMAVWNGYDAYILERG